MNAATNEPKAPRGASWALGALFVLVYLVPLGLRPLASPDEVRYAQVAREMVASGDWISPRFNGVRYFEKPALGHWLNAASLRVFGENAVAIRLPAAIATGLTALLVFFLSRRFLTQFAAVLATGIFLTTLAVAGVGTFAVLDAVLTFFLASALAAYYLALEEERPSRRRAYLALCGIACGGAFLVKGFVALAIAVIVAAPYLAARRQWRALLTTPWLPIAAAAAVILPWAVLIHLREPDFWHYFFWVQHVQRFAGHGAQHARPFWFYFAYLPLTGWPWILLLPAAVARLRGNTASARFLWYVAAWAVLPFLFLSLAKGKLLTYVLPCFVPVSILLASGLERYLVADRPRLVRIAVAVIAAVLTTVLAVVLAAQRLIGEPVYRPAELPKLAVLAVFLMAGIGCAVFAFRSRSRTAMLAAIAGTGITLVLPLQVALPERLLERAAPATAIARYAAASSETIVVSDASLFGATAWALKRDDIYVVSPGEMEYGLSYPESRHRWLDGGGLERLIEENGGHHEVLVIGRPASAPDIEPHLPRHRAERSAYGQVIIWRVPAS